MNLQKLRNFGTVIFHTVLNINTAAAWKNEKVLGGRGSGIMTYFAWVKYATRETLPLYSIVIDLQELKETLRTQELTFVSKIIDFFA
jgi:hypothetical protein